MQEIWELNAESHSQYLRVYLTHLRKKIEIPNAATKLLTREPGIGYRLILLKRLGESRPSQLPEEQISSERRFRTIPSPETGVINA